MLAKAFLEETFTFQSGSILIWIGSSGDGNLDNFTFQSGSILIKRKFYSNFNFHTNIFFLFYFTFQSGSILIDYYEDVERKDYTLHSNLVLF